MDGKAICDFWGRLSAGSGAIFADAGFDYAPGVKSLSELEGPGISIGGAYIVGVGDNIELKTLLDDPLIILNYQLVMLLIIYIIWLWQPTMQGLYLTM
jgi:hypothetical protein